jgi:hypothetical protein
VKDKIIDRIPMILNKCFNNTINELAVRRGISLRWLRELITADYTENIFCLRRIIYIFTANIAENENIYLPTA